MIFLDTNIILDLLEKRPRYNKVRLKILQIVSESDQKTSICISIITFANLFYILRKKYDKEFITKLISEIKILPAGQQESQIACQHFLRCDDVEDVIQIVSANNAKVSHFLTSDLGLIKDYQYIFDQKIKIVVIN